jgi:hypothetical protein
LDHGFFGFTEGTVRVKQRALGIEKCRVNSGALTPVPVGKAKGFAEDLAAYGFHMVEINPMPRKKEGVAVGTGITVNTSEVSPMARIAGGERFKFSHCSSVIAQGGIFWTQFPKISSDPPSSTVVGQCRVVVFGRLASYSGKEPYSASLENKIPSVNRGHGGSLDVSLDLLL